MEPSTTFDDVRYGFNLAALHERVYRRMDTVLTGTQLLASTAAVSGLLSKTELSVLVGGVLLALLTVLQAVLQPQGRGAVWGVLRSRYADLEALAHSAGAAGIDTQLWALRGQQPDPFDTLAEIALRRTRAQLQVADVERLTTWQRIVAAVV
jgi:hypothetical protein